MKVIFILLCCCFSDACTYLILSEETTYLLAVLVESLGAIYLLVSERLSHSSVSDQIVSEVVGELHVVVGDSLADIDLLYCGVSESSELRDLPYALPGLDSVFRRDH